MPKKNNIVKKSNFYVNNKEMLKPIKLSLFLNKDFYFFVLKLCIDTYASYNKWRS